MSNTFPFGICWAGWSTKPWSLSTGTCCVCMCVILRSPTWMARGNELGDMWCFSEVQCVGMLWCACVCKQSTNITVDHDEWWENRTVKGRLIKHTRTRLFCMSADVSTHHSHSPFVPFLPSPPLFSIAFYSRMIIVVSLKQHKNKIMNCWIRTGDWHAELTMVCVNGAHLWIR